MARERYKDRIEVFGYKGGQGLAGVLNESARLVREWEDDFELEAAVLRYEKGVFYLVLPFKKEDDFVEYSDDPYVEYIREGTLNG